MACYPYRLDGVWGQIHDRDRRAAGDIVRPYIFRASQACQAVRIPAFYGSALGSAAGTRAIGPYSGTT